MKKSIETETQQIIFDTCVNTAIYEASQYHDANHIGSPAFMEDCMRILGHHMTACRIPMVGFDVQKSRLSKLEADYEARQSEEQREKHQEAREVAAKRRQDASAAKAASWPELLVEAIKDPKKVLDICVNFDLWDIRDVKYVNDLWVSGIDENGVRGNINVHRIDLVREYSHCK